jgi:hypothetical protein
MEGGNVNGSWSRGADMGALDDEMGCNVMGF